MKSPAMMKSASRFAVSSELTSKCNLSSTVSALAWDGMKTANKMVEEYFLGR